MKGKMIIAGVLLGLDVMTTGAYACSLGYLNYEPKFAQGASSLSADEIRRFSDWRMKIRGYQAGFDVHVTVWQNDYAGVSAQLAEGRADNLRQLLVNFDIPEADIKEIKVQRSRQKLSKHSADQFFNTQRVDIEPRCPNACCDAPKAEP